jgi:hypothetical protein
MSGTTEQDNPPVEDDGGGEPWEDHADWEYAP